MKWLHARLRLWRIERYRRWLKRTRVVFIGVGPSKDVLRGNDTGWWS